MMHSLPDLAGNMVVFADSLDRRASRHRSGRKAATGHNPLPDQNEAIQARQRVWKWPETRAGRHQPTFLRTLPVSRVADHRGWGGDISDLDGLADAWNPPLENINDGV